MSTVEACDSPGLGFVLVLPEATLQSEAMSIFQACKLKLCIATKSTSALWHDHKVFYLELRLSGE